MTALGETDDYVSGTGVEDAATGLPFRAGGQQQVCFGYPVGDDRRRLQETDPCASDDQMWSKLNCPGSAPLIESYLTAILGFSTGECFVWASPDRSDERRRRYALRSRAATSRLAC